MTSPYTDETLMAFADGMLDEPLFSAVAEAVEHDAALAARLEQLVNGAALARHGFAPLLEPAGAELQASVRAAIARAERKPRWTWLRLDSWIFAGAGAIAASLALAVAVPMLQQPGAVATPGGIDQAELQAALDTLPSGASQALDDGRQLHAVASFTDADGILCREFEVPGYAVVACRDAADWRIAMAVATDATDQAYRPAAGLAALDAYLTEIGAGPPLLDADEQAALRSR